MPSSGILGFLGSKGVGNITKSIKVCSSVLEPYEFIKGLDKSAGIAICSVTDPEWSDYVMVVVMEVTTNRYWDAVDPCPHVAPAI